MKPHSRSLIVLAGLLMLLAGGCATTGPQWPAISDVPTEVRIQGRWVWAELMADNTEAAKTFYREAFGWEYDTIGAGNDSYTVIRTGGRSIGGIIHVAKPAEAVRAARWLPLMSVPDASHAADLAAAGGGKVIVPTKIFTGRGMAAVIADPEGAPFGVIRSDTGDPPDEFPAYSSWFWMELWAMDAEKMGAFYAPLGNYEVTRHEGPGERKEMRLASNGFPRAGILELERKDVPSTWLPYVRVKDVQMAVVVIVKAGGRIVVEPKPEIRNGKVAVFLDPLGAAVAVVEWKDDGEGEDRP